MSKSNVAAIRPQSSRIDGRELAYIDGDRDQQDYLILNAIKAAITLIADSNEHEVVLAADVLRLARDRLETSLFHRVTEEVAHV